MTWVWIVGLILSSLYLMWNAILGSATHGDPSGLKNIQARLRGGFVAFIFFAIMLMIQRMAFIWVIGLDISSFALLMGVLLTISQGELDRFAFFWLVSSLFFTIAFTIATVIAF